MEALIMTSHVLFGDSARKGAEMNRLPKVMPAKYAETSFITTVAMGNQNQKSPFKVLLAKNLHWKTTMQTVTIDHMN
jgi:hypothetical protein